ncbi:TetR/AcrR family transcriptional regulator [Streptomyces sp. NBC_01190]|uniref:TetR/AcrR family transcriptional regulator n=1 Tax=Streptomyces sp. NBC_01190 TaxID=2903767 RepID=UPI00386E9C18|nr:TetR/AcrR family transcriptional regulator [Streptomyces sp. NBC_01190]
MGSVTRQRRDANRRSPAEEQLVAALERLLKGGRVFTEISVQQILEEAGVSRATFYARFRDKSQLLIRLTDGLRARLLGLAQAWDPAAGEDGAERYARFFSQVIAIHRENYAVLSAVRELAAYDAAVQDFYTADLEEFEKAVYQTLVDQQRSGDTVADLDAVAAGRIIVWGGAQAIAHHIGVDDGSGDAAFARELGKIWWYGAYRRGDGG